MLINDIRLQPKKLVVRNDDKITKTKEILLKLPLLHGINVS